jgi:DNA-binding SARP family transcriptional activator
MEYRILGPLEVVDDTGRPVELPAAKERAVLSLLLLSPNRAVDVDRLADELWIGDPPPTARTTLRAYVSRLRKALGAAERIETVAGGYRLLVAAGETDVEQFEGLVADASAAAPDSAARLLTTALSLWRGPAFDEVADTARGQPEAIRLEELRLTAIEARVDAEIAAGRHATVVSELDSLCHAHPLRERLWGAWMLALYRSGRQAEALRAYDTLRRHLGEELGLEPSPHLADLEQAILQHASGLCGRTELPTGVVTFVLTDIEGSTALWDTAPAAMGAALADHDSSLDQLVREEGGVLLKAKGEGDATLSVFRRASAAVAAAAAMPAVVAAATAPHGLELRIRVAVHTGEAHERDGDYFGPTVNRAARLRTLASGGQVLLSGATAELVNDRLPEGFVLADIGQRELRGVSRPEHVHALVPAGTVSHPPALVPGLPRPLRAGDTTLFVGRGRELSRLEEVAVAAASDVQVVLVGGEPGIGKTSLAAAFARATHANGAVVGFGRCSEGLAVPYQPFIEALRDIVPAATLVPPRALAELSRFMPEVRDRMPGLPASITADPQTERFAMFEAVVTVLRDAATRAPVVLVLDDLQWATEETILLLRHVASADDLVPLMIVGTFRDREIGQGHPLDALRSQNVTRLRLGGLDRPAVEELVALSGLPQNLASAVHDRTAGNPFFVRATVDQLRETPDTNQLPAAIRDVIDRRVLRLPEPARHALMAAAVIGERFTVSVLEHVVPDIDVVAAIEAATDAGLLRDEGAAVAFEHAIVREAIESRTSPARLIRLHRLVGDALEALPDAAARVEGIAEHFAAAVAEVGPERAARALLAAARDATSRLSFEEAPTHAERGLSILGDAGDAGMRAQLQLVRAEALWLARRLTVEAFNSQLVSAAEQARDGAAPSVFAQAALKYVWAIGRPDPVAIALYDEAIARLGDDRPDLRARLLAKRASHRAQFGAGAEAVDAAADAVDLARRTDSVDAVLDTLGELNLALHATPRVRDRLAVAAEHVRLADAAGRTMQAANARYQRFIAYLELGRRDAAEEDVPALVADDAVWDALPFLPLVEPILALLDGDFQHARTLVAPRATLPPDDPGYFVVYMGTLLLAAREEGRPEALSFEAGLPPSLPGIRTGIALVLTIAGEPATIAGQLDQMCADDLAVVPRNGLFPATLCFLAELCAMTGDIEHAPALHRELSPYAGLAPMMGMAVGVVGAADRYLGMLDAVLGDADAAVEHFEAALRTEEGLRSPPLLARTKYWYGRTILERDRGAAETLLHECLATAEELGMAKLAGDARIALRQR